MTAKPKTISTMILNDCGVAVGSVSLHPNQKWDVVLYDDATDLAGIKYGCISLNINRDLFYERFSVIGND